MKEMPGFSGVASAERRRHIGSLLADAANGGGRARMREGNSAENLSILRRIALNLIRQDKSVKAGVKNRRLLASCDDAYRQKLLGIQALA